MQAGVLKSLIDHVPPETEMFINIDGEDIDVGSLYYDEEFGFITLSIISDSPNDDDEEGDDDSTDGQEAGSMCSLPEYRAPSDGEYKIKDL